MPPFQGLGWGGGGRKWVISSSAMASSEVSNGRTAGMLGCCLSQSQPWLAELCFHPAEFKIKANRKSWSRSANSFLDPPFFYPCPSSESHCRSLQIEENQSISISKPSCEDWKDSEDGKSSSDPEWETGMEVGGFGDKADHLVDQVSSLEMSTGK